MAFTHIHFNDQSEYGRKLRRALELAEESDQLLADVRNCMATMIDGDGSADGHYAEITTKFGFTTDALAHSAFSETDTVYGKTSGGVNDTSGARAARDQWFAKLWG